MCVCVCVRVKALRGAGEGKRRKENTLLDRFSMALLEYSPHSLLPRRESTLPPLDPFLLSPLRDRSSVECRYLTAGSAVSVSPSDVPLWFCVEWGLLNNIHHWTRSKRLHHPRLVCSLLSPVSRLLSPIPLSLSPEIQYVFLRPMTCSCRQPPFHTPMTKGFTSQMYHCSVFATVYSPLPTLLLGSTLQSQLHNTHTNFPSCQNAVRI